MQVPDANVERCLVPAPVRDFTSGDAGAWEAFVERHPGSTFFHRLGWRELMESEFRHKTHYLVAKQGSHVAGILPLVETRSRLFGHALVSSPFCAHASALADTPAIADALIDAAVDRARSLGVTHLELRSRIALRPEWPTQDLYVNFSRAILPTVDDNLLAVPRKQRAMVRKGIKNGLTSTVDSDVDGFFELYADNMHRHGTPPFARSYFRRLREVFGEACEVLTVFDGGTPISGVLSFYFRDTVLPYYAGDRVQARERAANDFKYWELMRRACERGLSVFDYGRSKRGSGSYDFKKNWGFESSPLYYEYRLLKRETIPQNNPANPKYRALIAVWRRMPIGLANAIGPHLVRGLG